MRNPHSALRNPQFGMLPHYAEKFLFSAVFLYYGYQKFAYIFSPDVRGVIVGAYGVGGVFTAAFAGVLNHLVPEVVLGVFNVCTGALLLSLKKPRRPPQSPLEVLVPIVATFFGFAYNLVNSHLPLEMTARLVPQSIVLTLTASALTTLGWSFSLYALFHLRRSFAVFVQLREIVTSGPYAYVRHPMYSGYLLVSVGIVVSQMNAAFLLLATAQTCIMMYRAMLEESMLAANDESYRRHMQRTGFLFPKFGSHAERSASRMPAPPSHVEPETPGVPSS